MFSSGFKKRPAVQENNEDSQQGLHHDPDSGNDRAFRRCDDKVQGMWLRVHGVFSSLPQAFWGVVKKSLAPDAEIPATEMVFGEELAGRAEAADDFHGCSRGCSAAAEKFFGLVFFKGMMFVVLAVQTVLPADLPVLFGIFYNRLVRINHAFIRFAMMDNRFFYLVFF
jgi:hypothetical protein